MKRKGCAGPKKNIGKSAQGSTLAADGRAARQNWQRRSGTSIRPTRGAQALIERWTTSGRLDQASLEAMPPVSALVKTGRCRPKHFWRPTSLCLLHGTPNDRRFGRLPGAGSIAKAMHPVDTAPTPQRQGDADNTLRADGAARVVVSWARVCGRRRFLARWQTVVEEEIVVVADLS